MGWTKSTSQFLLFAIKPLRHAESFWGWVELIIHLLIMLGIFISVGLGLTFETVRWLLTIVTPSLFATLFLIAGVRLQYRLSAFDELAKIKDGDVIKNKTINISLLFQNLKKNFVSNVTFERCILRGPCVVTFKGDNKLHGCGFLGTTRLEAKLLMKPNDDKSYTVVGIGEFVHCKFQYCTFKNVAFYVTGKEYDNLLSKIVQV